MTVYETELPNVGRKFEVPLDDGSRLAVLLQYNGTRVLYHQAKGAEDGEKVGELTSEQARQLGAVLGGAYFQPEPTEPEVPLGEDRIEWVTVGEEAAVVDETLRDALGDVAVEVLALRRDGETRGSPDPEAVLRAGDVVVTLGDKEGQRRVHDLFEGE